MRAADTEVEPEARMEQRAAADTVIEEPAADTERASSRAGEPSAVAVEPAASAVDTERERPEGH